MIQIKTTLFRNLDKICEEHYNELQASIIRFAMPEVTFFYKHVFHMKH